MDTFENKYKNKIREEMFKSFRAINLDDMHFCNLKAVIEAPSGMKAVEKFICDQPRQVFKNEKKKKRSGFNPRQ